MKMTDSVTSTLRIPNIPLANCSLKKNNSMDNTNKNKITLTVFFSVLTCQILFQKIIHAKNTDFNIEIGTLISENISVIQQKH